MHVCICVGKIQMVICLYDTLRGVMSEDKEKPRLTFENFHSEQPSGRHKAIPPKAAEKPSLYIPRYVLLYLAI